MFWHEAKVKLSPSSLPHAIMSTIENEDDLFALSEDINIVNQPLPLTSTSITIGDRIAQIKRRFEAIIAQSKQGNQLIFIDLIVHLG